MMVPHMSYLVWSIVYDIMATPLICTSLGTATTAHYIGIVLYLHAVMPESSSMSVIPYTYIVVPTAVPSQST